MRLLMYEPGVDAVVANYRTPADLTEFLESWYQHPPSYPWDLWIVNINPTEADTDVAYEWADKLGDGAHVAEYAFNCGYAHAVNQAALAGSRETFVAFNADVVLRAGALDECHEQLHAHPEWAILGPRQVNGHGRITHAGIFGTLDKPEHRGFNARDVGQFTDVFETAISVSGSAYFILREVWNKLTSCPLYREHVPDASGAFLPTQLFYEESWCSVHAIAHGYRVVYYGPVTITHKFHQAIQAAGVNTWAVKVMKESHETYRAACEAHGIPHD